MKHMIRLQGKEFSNKRSELTMVGYVISKNDHIKAIMKSKDEEDKNLYSHWLSNEEEEKFYQSNYFKNSTHIRNDRYGNVIWGLPIILPEGEL